ncbi:CTP synthase [Spiroplasma turonicum]|uniref:CTP synthase n=1 Tax=Spiroplasma turonicum TaxID=216946 RepID=A0A0K1P7K8_9MOLU|nr:CTP synthase [Spiroplasma turonicum]AKU80296.1 CTP synthetase [Spiroplasma turonicum]ALX71297.1 CTP synthetase [Spiroplasma turonicum]
MSKHIFITGGVVSGLGKGITGSSLGVLLKNSGLKIFMQKFDPYLNIDPGTMNPIEHGEVFVTNDGGETDLDLGHYERFIDVNLTKSSSYSAGRIYADALDIERQGGYKGKTVQVIPHITNLIKSKIYEVEKNNDYDVIISEIGGTVGDIESQPFLEAIRQIRMEKSKENVLFIHIALLPYLKVSNEFKTKPIQHSVKEMLSLGLQPDIIVARSEFSFEDKLKDKISSFCNVPKENVIECSDSDSIYKVPLIVQKSNMHKIVAKQLNLSLKDTDMSQWNSFVDNINASTEEVEITIVGKYVELSDAYLSVIESLKIAGYDLKHKIKLKWVNSRRISESNYEEILKDSKGILVPGGFGEEGIEGKICAAKYARVNNIPYLGICLGMQVACVEFARNVLNLKDASSTEINPNTNNPIIDILEGKNTKDIGGTLRLGAYKTTLLDNTLAKELYNSNEVIERHRHRYEFNNKYKEKFESNGMVFSGIYVEKNLVEIIEIPKNKFFIACQYHPEFTSRPNKPNPLFKGFIKSIIKNVQ